MEPNIWKLIALTVVCVILTSKMTHGSTCGSCTCSTSSVSCTYKSLTVVPSFDPTVVATVSRIDLSGNLIEFIGDKAFMSFQNSRVSYLYLKSNRISNVSENAFFAVDNITTLDLEYNRLSTLPHALQNLIRLQYLYLAGNSLASLDPRVISVIGNTLLGIEVDLQYMSHWPNEMHFLRHLQTLILYHLNETHLYSQMFQGFQGSLKSFKLYNTQLQSFSSVICDLQSLVDLHIYSAPKLNESSHVIFEPCKGNLSQVGALYLDNIPKLTVYPALMHTFSSVQVLSFQNDNLKFVNADSVSHVLSVFVLYLNGNKLTHVPYAINKFLNVTDLYLFDNLITDIENIDFAHLSKLQIVSLHSNPIVYISNNAFRHNTELRSIDLHNTQIRLLPTSLKLLPELSTLFLSNTLVECACDLANLKGWNVTSISFKSSPVKCYQASLLLKDFIQIDLQNC